MGYRMDADFVAQANNWVFPEVELDTKSRLNESLNSMENDLNQQMFTKLELAEIEHKKEIEEYNQEILNLKDEIDRLRMQFNNQVDLINKLVTKLKNPVSIIDEEIVELMQDIIKKLTKRIVIKEMTADASTIEHMIKELRNLIDAKNGLIAVHLSSNDHANLQKLQSDFTQIARIDNTLTDGDIIIKSNFGEVRALLNERIEQLIRVDHD